MLLIAGPTGSGKSALAMALADRLGGAVIVTTDSMQIYSDLNILTARASAADEARHPHVLSGTEDGGHAFSAAQWRQSVAERLAKMPDVLAVGRDKRPDETRLVATKPLIFVGGTGLYFKALTEGLSPVPSIPDSIRREVRTRLETEGAPALHRELDAAMADQLSPTDSQRVARALEVLLATGRSLADWQALPPEGALLQLEDTTPVVLDPPRDWLEARIRDRARTMLEPEALEEVRALLARGLRDELPVMRAIGVSVIDAYLKGDMDHEAALDALTVETRRYAKRQATWFRGQMADWPRLDPSQMSVEAMADTLLEKDTACAR